MATPRRAALVLAGGGARGAYEAGVLSFLYESVYPQLEPGFEFDVISGTSVGAIHAAYGAASANLRPAERSRRLLDTWQDMEVGKVLRLSGRDLLGIPLRALGFSRLERQSGGDTGTFVVGGLVDLAPLETIVSTRIPWEGLRGNLAGRRPGALCVSCTEIRTGRVTVFMDGPDANPEPWRFDPNARAVHHEITARHVRASAAIPFLFPAVRIGDRYYVDGGLRMNTPISPALRLGAERVLVVALKHTPGVADDAPSYPEDVITQPAFLLGKVLDALMLDQLEYELQRIGLVNAWIEQGGKVFGDEFLEQINVAVRQQRGADYRAVRTAVIRPSRDLGRTAADCFRGQEGRQSLGVLSRLVTGLALRGLPSDEGDLLSYLYFDRCFTGQLVEMGREDARAQADSLLELLAT